MQRLRIAEEEAKDDKELECVYDCTFLLNRCLKSNSYSCSFLLGRHGVWLNPEDQPDHRKDITGMVTAVLTDRYCAVMQWLAERGKMPRVLAELVLEYSGAPSSSWSQPCSALSPVAKASQLKQAGNALSKAKQGTAALYCWGRGACVLVEEMAFQIHRFSVQEQDQARAERTALYSNMSLELFRQGRYACCVHACDTAMQLAPPASQAAKVAYRKALALAAQHHKHEALRCLDEALDWTVRISNSDGKADKLAQEIRTARQRISSE
jgi:tetratricopeptide (TPR) repeat protein